MVDVTMKVYAAPGAPTYLVQQADHNNFLIHREISTAERDELEPSDVFMHEGKWFRFVIMNVARLDIAESVIQGFFRAHESMKQCVE